MNNFKSIRTRLGVTQAVLATGIGCTQGNVGHYEQGQTVPPDAAKRLIEFAKSLGHEVTFDDIYGELAPDGAAPAAPETTDNRRHTESQPFVVIPDRRTHCEPRPKQSKKRKGG